MISPIVNAVMPVFLLVIGGYFSVKFTVLPATEINGILKFTQKIAIPIFLFLSILNLDLFLFFYWFYSFTTNI